MNLIGTALAGIYVVVATRSACATPEAADGSAETEVVPIKCASDETKTSAVLKPNTTVKVTCSGSAIVREDPETPGDKVYLDAECSQPGQLSKVCPGATVKRDQQGGPLASTLEGDDPEKGTIVTLWFPQLPASQQVVCVKCPDTKASNKECKAVITVAAAPPEGPQACAVGGTSITLEINRAGGSAQFACGTGRTLAPPEPTKAYAVDCSKVETLKDMTRSAVPEKGYLTVKVDKLKRKRLCYLCEPRASSRQQEGGHDGPCKVYVQVSGSTKFSSSVSYGLALPCLAAMLRFT